MRQQKRHRWCESVRASLLHTYSWKNLKGRHNKTRNYQKANLLCCWKYLSDVFYLVSLPLACFCSWPANSQQLDLALITVIEKLESKSRQGIFKFPHNNWWIWRVFSSPSTTTFVDKKQSLLYKEWPFWKQISCCKTIFDKCHNVRDN